MCGEAPHTKFAALILYFPETPEHKAGVSITREQIEVSITSCVLPTFRRTTPLTFRRLMSTIVVVPHR